MFDPIFAEIGTRKVLPVAVLLLPAYVFVPVLF